jgi:hypothetical protein
VCVCVCVCSDMYIMCSIHSLFVGHHCWFHSLTDVNSTSINMGMQDLSSVLIYLPPDICPRVVLQGHKVLDF